MTAHTARPAPASVSRETERRLADYAALLRRWNARINLVSRADLDDLERRHVEDSLQLLPLLPPPSDGPAADLGSGAGLPGLILAVAEPNRPWHLVESDRRKAAFLQAAAGDLAATNVTVHARRIEDTALPSLAVVTARALAPLPALLAHAHRLLAPGGVAVFPKGRAAGAELTDAARAWTVARVERVASRTDPGATILRLSGVAPRA